MTREAARAAIDHALTSRTDTGLIAQAEATFYLGEQVERIADMIRGGFYVEKTDYGFTAIEKMEARGQQQLVASTKLPVANQGGYQAPDDAPYLALGFTFEPPDPDDQIFREATLPPGWEKKGTEHSMHSVIVDERGEERVGIFFKAAFYDRHAHMYLIALCVDCGDSNNSHPWVERPKRPDGSTDYDAPEPPRPCSTCGCKGMRYPEKTR